MYLHYRYHFSKFRRVHTTLKIYQSVSASYSPAGLEVRVNNVTGTGMAFGVRKRLRKIEELRNFFSKS